MKMEVQEQTSYVPETDQSFQDQEESIIITPNKKKLYLSETNSSILSIKKKIQKQPINKTIIAILIMVLFVFVWIYLGSTNTIVENLIIQQSTVNDSLQNDKVKEFSKAQCKINSKVKGTQNLQDQLRMIAKQKIDFLTTQQRKESSQVKQNHKQELEKQVKQAKQIKSQANPVLQKQKSFQEKEKKRLQKNLQEKAIQKYHPWQLDNNYKQTLLEKYKNMPFKNINQSELMPIVQDREKEILPILSEFQKINQVVDYSKIKMTDEQRQLYQKQYHLKLSLRKEQTEKKLNQQKRFIPNPDGFFSQEQYKITRKQWYSAFQSHTLVGTNLRTDSQANQRAYKQIQTYQKKYNIGSYKKQLRMCIISPGANNQPYQRYLWHIQSVLQQNYSNYRLIIIDDASTDKTVQLISKHLKWRNVSQDKVTIVRNRKSQKALANTFYATHKFCDFGEIQIVLDSDDEFIGRQVLKVLNAVYQKQKYLTVYSTLIMGLGNPRNPINVLGISRDHLKQDIQQNIFRLSHHRGYSSLRTMLSDLFLLTKPQSLKDKDGKFYWIVGDNAYYYAALEQSCGKIHYLPQIFYYYNMNTGINDDNNRAKYKEEYKNLVTHIDYQKNYRCIANEYMEIDNYGL